MCSASLVVREMFLGFKNPLMLGATKYNTPFVLCANDSETFIWLYKFMKMELENDLGKVETSFTFIDHLSSIKKKQKRNVQITFKKNIFPSIEY